MFIVPRQNLHQSPTKLVRIGRKASHNTCSFFKTSISMHNLQLKALTAKLMIYQKTQGLVHEMEISGIY